MPGVNRDDDFNGKMLPESGAGSAPRLMPLSCEPSKNRSPLCKTIGENLANLTKLLRLKIDVKMRHMAVTLIEDLQALGIAFVSLGEEIDCTRPAGKFQLPILAALSPLRMSADNQMFYGKTAERRAVVLPEPALDAGGSRPPRSRSEPSKRAPKTRVDQHRNARVASGRLQGLVDDLRKRPLTARRWPASTVNEAEGPHGWSGRRRA